VKPSYTEDLREGMAGRAGRGRGRGHGGWEEDPWGGAPGWWNPRFHPA
jgi:hypothetical protein